MNLAQELNLVSSEHDRVIRTIRLKITTLLTETAQLGGYQLSVNFEEGTVDAVKDIIFAWLEDEGFTTRLDGDGVIISWKVLRIPHRLTAGDRVRERITAATRYEKTSVTLSMSMYSPAEIEVAVDELLHDGYTVDVDSVFQEISVSWE